MASVEPAVVFTSVAQLAASEFSDTCEVAIEQDDGLAFLIARPGSASPDWTGPPVTRLSSTAPPGQLLSEHALSTPILAPGHGDRPGYRGVLIQRWRCHEPTRSDAALARMTVARAVTLIQRERAAAELEQSRHAVQNLQQALATSREIGAAVGIIMSSRRMTHSQAFELLSATSRARNLKVRDIAGEVVLTGVLEPPPVVAVKARD